MGVGIQCITEWNVIAGVQLVLVTIKLSVLTRSLSDVPFKLCVSVGDCCLLRSWDVSRGYCISCLASFQSAFKLFCALLKLHVYASESTNYR